MKKVRKLASLLLAMVMMLSLCITTYADGEPTTGSITISNATKREAYHVYKLFDSSYGDAYDTTDSDGNKITMIPTNYTATGTQRDSLEAADGNVFEFTPIVENVYTVTYIDIVTGLEAVKYDITGTEKDKLAEDGNTILTSELTSVGSYQVTVKSDVTEEEVIAFVKSYVHVLSKSEYQDENGNIYTKYAVACEFPEAEEYTGDDTNVGIEDCVATASTVKINGLPLGYYFVTSTYGSVISLNTTNPDATIQEKNTQDPIPDNETDPDPDTPLKNVYNDAGQDIDGENVEVNDTLTYKISYTNDSDVTLNKVVVTDEAPLGTEYQDATIDISFYTTKNGALVTYDGDIQEGILDHSNSAYSDDTIYYELSTDDADQDEQENLTWTLENLPVGVTLVAEFKVTVTEDALDTAIVEDNTIINDADMVVTIGKNTYDLKTNVVKNTVKITVKDVLDESGYSIDGESVKVGSILTYTISYTVQESDINTKVGATTADLEIVDAPPTGTVYVANSEDVKVVDENGYTVSDYTKNISVSSDNTITWEVGGLKKGYTVTASFQVEVTEAALTITTNSIDNTATVEIGENKYTTNTVSNNTPDPDDKKPVKDVQDESGTSIDGEKVEEDDVLTYVITYTVPKPDTNETLGTLTIEDAAPKGTTYVVGSAKGTVASADGNTSYQIDSSHINAESDGSAITWTVNDGEDGDISLAGGETVTVSFQVIVNQGVVDEVKTNVYNNTDYSGKIVNDADVTLGDRKYTTNLVKNPVDTSGEKDVKNSEGVSINNQVVSVGQILTYTITYTNEANIPGKLTITDAPPAGTTYVNGSAAGTITTSSNETTSLLPSAIEYSTDENGNYTFTWTIDVLEAGATAEVSFQVRVTAEALTWDYSTIENEALVTMDGNTKTTNIVYNPLIPQDEEFGKVIINEDGSKSTASTGAFEDTVTFDVSINAVNGVANDAGIDADGNGVIDPVQVSAYYIYDRMDPGFDLNVDSLELTIDGTKYTLEVDALQNVDNEEGVTTYSFVDSNDNAVAYLFVKENYEEDGYTLITVNIPWVENWVDENNWDSLYPNCTIHLIYNATINTDAEIAGDGNYNRAIYDYATVDNNDPIEPNPTKPTYPTGSDLNHYTYEMTTQTYTYALGIQKISSITGEALENAQFTLVDAGGNTIYAVETADGYYDYTSDSTASGATSTFVTNSDGQIIINGVDIGTYTFTETKAPQGYVKLTEPVTVNATMSSYSYTTESYEATSLRYFKAVTEDEWATLNEKVYVKNDDGSFTLAEMPETYTAGYYKEVTSSASGAVSTESTTQSYTFNVSVTNKLVANAPGSTLPTTGSIGTTIFYIVGAILVLGAVVVLITRRRMRD